MSKADQADTTFKRLPYNFCAVSLQPFQDPVSTADGTVFDRQNIDHWIESHGTDPVSGKSLKSEDLINLNFTKNDEGDFVDPVTFKIFTNNTHIVALRNTGNVFAYDTVERLNIKGKMWRDLISDDPFSRKDIISIQDPQNVESRNLSSFKHVKDGTSNLTKEQEGAQSAGINKSALGNAASLLTESKNTVSSSPAVGKYLHQLSKASQGPTKPSSNVASKSLSAHVQSKSSPVSKSKVNLQQTSYHTTGRAAASLTSTGLTPDTSGALATLTDEEYLLRPRRVKAPGYIRLLIPPHGSLTLELLPEHAPKAVWNMLALVKSGYYNGVLFHRNIRSFMLQGGDPTGTGRGGKSIWGGIFPDEFQNGGTLSHDKRGMLSMANKGKDTNSSQFFITYAPCKHLDRKHTVFGRVVDGWDTLDKVERVAVSEKEKRPLEDLKMEEVTVLVDPFEDFLKQRDEKAVRDEEEEDIRKRGGRDEDRTTWTGKRIKKDGDGSVVEAPAVGRYLAVSDKGTIGRARDEEILEEWETKEPAKKKLKNSGGFGDFDSW